MMTIVCILILAKCCLITDPETRNVIVCVLFGPKISVNVTIYL